MFFIMKKAMDHLKSKWKLNYAFILAALTLINLVNDILIS